MSNPENPYGGSTGAGNYQMAYGSQGAEPATTTTAAPIAANASPVDAQIKDISTAEFVGEVIEASKSIPVLIDFWAPWCGPCKQLTPILEKVAKEFSGQAKLVKMNTEQHPEIPGQMGIQSIPAVVAFVDGKPVDAFMGVRPESEIRSFFEKHAGPATGVDMEKILRDARHLIGQDDMIGAANLLTALLQSDPQNPAGTALLASISLRNGESEQAQELFQSIREDDHGLPDVAAVKAELELADQADDLGDIQQLILAVENDGKDFQAKFDLSLAYNAANKRGEAADAMLSIINASREWNDDGARKQLLKYFEAWGPTDDATITGRRKLSALLFS